MLPCPTVLSTEIVPLMGVDDRLGDGESEAHPAVDRLAFALPELLEHVRQSIRRDPDPRVANSKHCRSVLDAALEHDPAAAGS